MTCQYVVHSLFFEENCSLKVIRTTCDFPQIFVTSANKYSNKFEATIVEELEKLKEGNAECPQRMSRQCDWREGDENGRYLEANESNVVQMYIVHR